MSLILLSHCKDTKYFQYGCINTTFFVVFFIKMILNKRKTRKCRITTIKIHLNIPHSNPPNNNPLHRISIPSTKYNLTINQPSPKKTATSQYTLSVCIIIPKLSLKNNKLTLTTKKKNCNFKQNFLFFNCLFIN